MPGNVDAVLFVTGFAVGAACILMLGFSLAEEHGRRRILPATIAGALVAGVILGWSLNYFFHWSQRGP